MRKSFLKASLLTFLMSQSQAATLEIHGSASVNKGAGFTSASSNMHLDGGDRVRAIKGCTKIVYENGYRTKICDGQMAVVISAPPQVIVSGSLKDTPAAVVAPDESTDLVPVGILFAAGIGTAAAVGSSGDAVRSAGDNNRAASP